MAVLYEDLLGKPYRLHAVDCSTVAETVLARLGLHAPPTSPWRVPCSSGEQGEFEAYLGGAASRWEVLGRDVRAATQDGDIILTGAGVSRGMFVTVDSLAGLFLTAQTRQGVVAVGRSHLMRMSRSVLGVYRLTS
jgi:hypothetical protein